MKNQDISRRQVVLCTAGAFGVALRALEPAAAAVPQQAPGRFHYHDIHAALEAVLGDVVSSATADMTNEGIVVGSWSREIDAGGFVWNPAASPPIQILAGAVNDAFALNSHGIVVGTARFGSDLVVARWNIASPTGAPEIIALLPETATAIANIEIAEASPFWVVGTFDFPICQFGGAGEERQLPFAVVAEPGATILPLEDWQMPGFVAHATAVATTSLGAVAFGSRGPCGFQSCESEAVPLQWTLPISPIGSVIAFAPGVGGAVVGGTPPLVAGSLRYPIEPGCRDFAVIWRPTAMGGWQAEIVDAPVETSAGSEATDAAEVGASTWVVGERYLHIPTLWYEGCAANYLSVTPTDMYLSGCGGGVMVSGDDSTATAVSESGSIACTVAASGFGTRAARLDPVWCAADLTGDDVVDSADIAALLSARGETACNHPAGLALEPAVGPRAFAALLAAWGPCTCPSARVRRDAELGTALSCLGFDCFGSFRDWYLEALPAQRCGACSLLMQVLYGGDS
jgi:hypothetical protein